MRLLSLFLAGTLWAVAVYAHDPGLSSATVTLSPNQIEAELVLNAADLARAGTESTFRQNSAKAQHAIARDALAIFVNDIPLVPNSVAIDHSDPQNVALKLGFPAPDRPARLRIESKLLPHLPFGHRQQLQLYDGPTLLLTRLLSAEQIIFEGANFVSDPASPAHTAPSSAGGFYSLGIEHVLTGYDHLLFLFALLLVCERFASAAGIISCFTIAHSITLALASLGLIQIPSRWVEAVIAGSIVYVAVENLFGAGSIRWRWVLTSAFGLVHGLGFAGVLLDLHIGERGSDALWPLLLFNLGVETGQLAIAAVVLPLLWWFRRFPFFTRIGVRTCSAIIAAIGCLWLVERTLG
jgi:hydrogenase/urease accessory protein HupE